MIRFFLCAMFYLNGPFKLFITNIFIAFSYQILRNNVVPNQSTRVQYENVIFDIFCNKSLFFRGSMSE